MDEKDNVKKKEKEDKRLAVSLISEDVALAIKEKFTNLPLRITKKKKKVHKK